MLNNILEENMPIPGAAINFNLYEEADLYWSIQLLRILMKKMKTGVVKCILLESRDVDGKRYSILSNDKTVFLRRIEKI